MLYSDCRIANHDTYSSVVDAIAAIEANPLNYVGGWQRWTSGLPTYLKSGAEKKIAALLRKEERLEDAMYKALGYTPE